MVDARRGFTLLELLVLLGMLTVLAGAAAPQVSAMMGSLELRSAAVRLSSALVRARLASLCEGRPWWVRIVDEATFTVGPAGGNAGRTRLPGRVRFAGATSGGDARFLPDGWAENATFTLERDSRIRRVVVNQRGRVTVGTEVAS